MRVGFYGTERGLTADQTAALVVVVNQLPVEVVHVAGPDETTVRWLEGRYPIVRHTGGQMPTLQAVVAACVTFICPHGDPRSKARIEYAHSVNRLTIEIDTDGETLWSRGEHGR